MSDKRILAVLANARRIRSHGDEALRPVALLDMGNSLGIVPLDLSTDLERRAHMVALGVLARKHGLRRAFVVQDTLVIYRSFAQIDAGDIPPDTLTADDLPLDDHHPAIFIMEINFLAPEKSASILQEYRFLGLPEPVYEAPIAQSATPVTGIFLIALRAFNGDMCGIGELTFHEEDFRDTVDPLSPGDIDDFLKESGLGP